jgi:hypothetical protein
MNCEFIKEHLDEICSEELEARQLEPVKKHVAVCEDCAALTEQHQIYLNTMQQFESPELTPGSAATMLRNVRLNHSKPHHSPFSGFLKGFAAASVIFICLVSLWHYWPNNLVTPIVSQQNALLSAEVSLVISVPEDMPNADLTLILPDDVSLAAYKGSKELNWIVDLKKGANILSLPIEVAAGQDFTESHHFIAKINYNNKKKEFELNVNLRTS